MRLTSLALDMMTAIAILEERPIALQTGTHHPAQNIVAIGLHRAEVAPRLHML